jgi:hypothetical protein
LFDAFHQSSLPRHPCAGIEQQQRGDNQQDASQDTHRKEGDPAGVFFVPCLYALLYAGYPVGDGGKGYL